MQRLTQLILLVLIASLPSLQALMPGVEWVQEEGRWRLMDEMPKSLDQPGSASHESAADLMAQARIAQDKGSNWNALGRYKNVIKDHPNTVFAPEAHYQRGIIYTERHQFKKAREEYEAIMRRYPEYPKFNQVISNLYLIGERVQDGARPYYWGIIPGFREYKLGLEAYEAVVKNAPFSEFAPLALMNIAVVANKDGKEEEAIDALDRLINTYPGSLLTADAYLTLAQTYASLVQGPAYDQEATRQALSYFQDYMILYPNTTGVYDAEAGLYYMRETLAKSKYGLGDFYYKYRNNPRAALTFYNEAITVDPNSSVAAQARVQIQKIRDGIPAPKTPVDWVFGRYQRPTLREYLEQSEVDNLEDESFQIQSTEAFLETPGAMAEEVITPGEPTQEYIGVGAPLEPFFGDPAMVEPIDTFDGQPEMIDPAFGEPFEEGIMEPYQAPGPTTPEQENVDKMQREAAQNPNLPAGAQ